VNNIQEQKKKKIHVEENDVDSSVTTEKKKKKKQKNLESSELETIETKVVELPNHIKASSFQREDNSNGLNSSVRKNFFKEHVTAKNFTADEINTYRIENKMTVTFIDNTSGQNEETEPQPFGQKKDDLKPIRNFDELILPEPTMKFSFKKFVNPTPIQSQCWPFILAGRDLVGIAETGSGKTLAFLIPALAHIKDQKQISKKNPGPIALILAPTRELAIQTFEVAEEAANACNLRSACFYGGVSKEGQYENLKKGIHILVSTPGRLRDLIEEEKISLNRVTYMVLDEADRMLDSGFEKDVRAIMKLIPKDRQTIMFSATWPLAIQSLASAFLSCPVRITIGSTELTANHKVTQNVEVLNFRDKERRLKELLLNFHISRKNRILIFVLYKREAPMLQGILSACGYKVATIHGDMPQSQRIQALQSFKDGINPLLVATDVAARGLDIPNVEYVINYSFPLTVEDYVHRIGRTGRAGKTGISYTFFTTDDKIRAGELIAVLQEAGAEVPSELRELGSYGTAKKFTNYMEITIKMKRR